MTFNEYLELCNQEWGKVRRGASLETWRVGQLYFNVLYDVKPDLANEARGALLDPFHRDDRLPLFLSFVAINWNQTNA
jgi:hypothetical protein